MSLFLSIKSIITRFNYIIALIGALVVFATMFIMAADVSARFLKLPLPGAVELTEIALGIMVFLGWGYTQEQKAHVTIDVVYKKLPSTFRRFLDIINPIIGLVFMGIIAWISIDFILYSKASGEYTENLMIPVWPFKITILIGAISFCLQLIMDTIQALQKINKN